jgi:hypothetical protein
VSRIQSIILWVLWRDNLVAFTASEIWPDFRTGIWWQGPYKRRITVSILKASQLYFELTKYKVY